MTPSHFSEAEPCRVASLVCSDTLLHKDKNTNRQLQQTNRQRHTYLDEEKNITSARVTDKVSEETITTGETLKKADIRKKYRPTWSTR